MTRQYYNSEDAKNLLRYTQENMYWKVKNMLEYNKYVINYNMATHESLEYACDTNKIEIVLCIAEHLKYKIDINLKKKVYSLLLKSMINDDICSVSIYGSRYFIMSALLCCAKSKDDVNDILRITRNHQHKIIKSCYENVEIASDESNKILNILVQFFDEGVSDFVHVLDPENYSFVTSFLCIGKQHDLALKILNEKYNFNDNSDLLKTNIKNTSCFTDIKFLV